MSDIIQQYLNKIGKEAFDDYIDIKKRFIGAVSDKKKNVHIREFEALKQTQEEFHEYVLIMIKAIAENVDTLKKTKDNSKYNKQKKEIKKTLKHIGEGILETEKYINYNTNVLLDLTSTGSNKKGVLSKREINRLKNENIPLLHSVFQPESGCELDLPQEPLFSLIGFFISLCRYTMRLCSIQQQIRDICFEEEFDPPTRKEILYINNLINEKLSEIKEEVHMSNMRIDEISTSQIELNFKQEDHNRTMEQGLKKRNEADTTKALKPIICLAIIDSVLKNVKLEVHLSSIKKRLSNWNTYIRTEGTKGEEPLADYDFARHRTIDYFKDWVITTFLPDYRARLRNKRGDVLKDAVHGLPGLR